ncbi:MAG: anti-sigma factor family protein [Verrucomicrobiota bacterium]
MNEHEQNELWEKSLRSRLTPNEQAQLESWLAARPDLRAQWEEELALCQVIRQLPDAPVSSNFTALVMQAVAQEERAAQRAEAPAADGFMVWLRKHFAQLTASTAVVALAAVLAVQQQQPTQTVTAPDANQAMAEQIKEMAKVGSVPSVDLLMDYEPIRRMSQGASQGPVGPDLDFVDLAMVE